MAQVYSKRLILPKKESIMGPPRKISLLNLLILTVIAVAVSIGAVYASDGLLAKEG